ncbi:MAG: S1 RNA-binding domain-containing protein, partial [Alicyclobacillus macrosporangiidus]|uniref:S1 RNA-binding domain-containing protein n=1 Tax=Alicyclobacillus macrosporangiidus TaxID=392015 RepID=UPI0026EF89D0
RYPDLVVHRIIRDVLAGRMHGQREERMREFVAEAAAHSSIRERVAQDAERETDQLKMVEYMLDHVGEEFDGIISGVTQFGLFVQLTNGVEGLIHISYLTDDYYVLNEKQMALVGERTRRVFRLGDPVRVRVTGANKEELTIDFELVAHHREGTLVVDDGVESVVYDEDLSPRERRRAVAERAAKARRPRGARGAWANEVEAGEAFGGRRRRAAGSTAEAWTGSGTGGSRKRRGRRSARAEVDFSGASAPNGRSRNRSTGSRRKGKAAKAARAAKGGGAGGSKRGRKARGMESASIPGRVQWPDLPQ